MTLARLDYSYQVLPNTVRTWPKAMREEIFGLTATSIGCFLLGPCSATPIIPHLPASVQDDESTYAREAEATTWSAMAWECRITAARIARIIWIK